MLGKRANRNRSTFVETQTTTKGTDERRKEEEEEEEEEESHAPSTYFSRYVIAPSIASKKVVVVFETPSHLLLLFCNNEDKREMGSNSLRLFLRAKLKGRIIITLLQKKKKIVERVFSFFNTSSSRHV